MRKNIANKLRALAERLSPLQKPIELIRPKDDEYIAKTIVCDAIISRDEILNSMRFYNVSYNEALRLVSLSGKHRIRDTIIDSIEKNNAISFETTTDVERDRVILIGKIKILVKD